MCSAIEKKYKEVLFGRLPCLERASLTKNIETKQHLAISICYEAKFIFLISNIYGFFKIFSVDCNITWNTTFMNSKSNKFDFVLFLDITRSVMLNLSAKEI